MSQESDQLTVDVAVLKSQLDHVQSDIQRVSESMHTGFATLGNRMDMISVLVRDVSTMQERQVAHGDGLARAFNELVELRREIISLEAEEKRWRIDHEFNNNLHEKKTERGIGIAIGISACFALIVSLVTWFAKDVMDETRDNTKLIQQIQLEEARRHGNPL